jgi:HK97 family phage major capsid protein
MDPELKKKIEEIQSLAAEGQKKHTEMLEGKADKTTVDKIAEEFAKLSEIAQKNLLEVEAEKKAREELELAISKMGANGSGAEVKSSPEYIAEFSNYLRYKSNVSPEQQEAEFKNLVMMANPQATDRDIQQAKALLVGSNPDGGYFVPVQQNMTLVKRLFETSPLRSVAEVLSCSSEAMEFYLDDDEFTSGWVAETDARTETETSKIGSVEIAVNEQYAEPKATQKMLDDAMFNVEAWLNGKISDKFARTENTAFITGSGVKQPKGILTYADWATLGQYQRNALETRSTAAASVFTGDDFIDLQSDLLAGYRGTWGMNRKTWAQVLKLKDAVDGNYLLNPAMLFSGALGMQLLGDPVLLLNDMPDKADGVIPVIYGDFREGYKILDRIGIRIIRDPYTTKGYVKFYTTKRTGGGVVNFQAIKRLKITAA